MLKLCRHWSKWLTGSACAAALLLFLPGKALAQDADPNLCIPSMGGLAAAPTIDGVVDGDPGWNGAMKVNLKRPGGTSRLGIMQIGRVGNNLYLSFEVEGSPSPAVDDLIVLAFSTTSSPIQDWRAHVFPFIAADTAPNLTFTNHVPRLQQTWRDSTVATSGSDVGKPKWNLPSAVPIGSFIGETKVGRTGNNWAVEMRIPTTSVLADAGGATAIYLPSSAPATTFKFYANVISTSDLTAPLSPTFIEDPWPQNVPMLAAGGAASGGDFAHNNTPLSTNWATASTFTRNECKGVYLASNTSVGVRHNSTAAPGYTSQTGPGPFRAGGSPSGAVLTTVEQCQTLADDTPWPAGTPALPDNFYVAKPGNDGSSAAPGVSVKFYVAPWGIPGAFDPGAPNAYWQPVGELYKPASMTGTVVHTTTPVASIPPDVGGNPALASYLSTPSWRLTYKQACVYTKSAYYGSVGHHCLHAEVTSLDPSVKIRNKSVQINHNFVPIASPAEMDAVISLKGRGHPAVRGKPHQVILYSRSLVQSFKRDGAWYFSSALKPSPMPAAISEAGIRAGTLLASERAATVAPTMIAPYQFRALGPVPAEKFPKGVAEGMTVITEAFVRRPDSLIIGSKRYQRADYIGGYSYFAGRAQAAQSWSESIALKPGLRTASGLSPTLHTLESKPLMVGAVPVRVAMMEVGENDDVTVSVRANAEGAATGTPGGNCGTTGGLTRLAGDGVGGALTGALLVAGGVGVGGLAFLRRRKSDPQEKTEEQDKA